LLYHFKTSNTAGQLGGVSWLRKLFDCPSD
jgi:hypothetical protein